MKARASFLLFAGFAGSIVFFFGQAAQAAAPAAAKPNILWLIGEDFGQHLGCYGAKEVSTPNLDRLAAQGVRYTRLYNGHVCSPSRSAFNTGMYATTINAHNHRSNRDRPLPAGVRVLSDWMRQAGYFTANVRELPPACGFKGTGKTDWNFKYDGQPYDSDKWSDLKSHQPFYAQVNFSETHRAFKSPKKANPARVEIPPYYPDHPVTREDWARYLDDASELDRKAGLVLAALEQDGLADNTVVVFFGDNGQSHVRGKQFCYEEGLLVPLLIRWPKRFPPPAHFQPGTVDDRLLHGIDLAPTMLALAGAPKPPKMQGQVFLGDRCEPDRQFVFGYRDRCDMTVMRIRTVRDARYRYIRNFTPHVPFLAFNEYKGKQYPVWSLLPELHAQGKLTPPQAFLCQPTMPAEELYDLTTDPWEIKNLAKSDQPEHRAARQRLRTALEKWIVDTDDQGRHFESLEELKAEERRFVPERDWRPTPGSKEAAEAKALKAPSPKRPNIILAMTDDQGWADVGYDSAHNPERDKVTTPTLDAMAATGLRFNRFYAQAPLCSPTRGSVVTGRHPFRYGTFSPGSPFRNQEITIAHALRTVGYTTGHFGKWHLNGVSGPGKPIAADDPLSPGRCGFDEWFSVTNYFECDWTFSRRGTEVKTAGDGSDAIVAEALKFIGAAAQSQTPFLALIWFGSVHVPIKPWPEYQEKAGGSAYYGEVYGVDHSLATLRSELRRLGIADHTLLWFCSDNGGVPAHSVGGLRGKKGTVWEGGLRVPGIIEWPGRIRKPAVTDVPAMTSDIYPTLLDLVGVQMPNQVKPLDGISLVPLIDGQMTERPKPIAFWHGGKGDKDAGHAALTDNRYKLHKLAPDKYELYDLSQDQTESNNVAADHPEVVARMKATLLDWQDSVVQSLAGEDYATGKPKDSPTAKAKDRAKRKRKAAKP